MFDVGHVLVGSQNYNLDGPNSDRDYKILMCPDLDDLYFRRRAEKGNLPEEYKTNSEHYSVMDIRTFNQNVLDGNVNALEMLFSTGQADLNASLFRWMTYTQKLYQDGYLVTVFPHFFMTMNGLVFNSFDRYGVNRKTASRALYFGNFVEYIVANNFKISWDSWRNEIVTTSARGMRFDKTIPLPTRVQFDVRFDCLEQMSLDAAAEANHKLTYEQVNAFETRKKDLFNKMKDLVVLQLL